MSSLRRTSALAFAATCLVAGGLSPAQAQLAPVGPETRVDSVTSEGLANDPRIGLQGDGSFVIAWDSGESEPPLLFARHFGPDGSPSGAEPSNVGVGGGEATATEEVATLGRGFDVVWREFSDLRPEKSPFFHRHLNRRGVPDSGEPSRLGTAETQWVWSVPGFGFVSGRPAPRAHGFAVQRLGAKGRPVGPEIRVNSRPVDDPEPFLLGLRAGGFVAVWAGVAPGPSSPPQRLLRARLFDTAGAPLGPDFDLNSVPPDAAQGQFLTAAYSVTAGPDGGFAVAWTLVDDERSTLFLRSFDREGHAFGPEVAEISGEGSVNPTSAAVDNAGNVLLLFIQITNEPSVSELRMQLFDRFGAVRGPVQELNSEASADFDEPSTGSAIWTGDSWLVAWSAEIEEEERSALFLRRFVVN